MILNNQQYFLKSFLVIFLFLQVVKCYPLGKENEKSKLDMKEEKHFPNGTVVGYYKYLDKEGTPVHVKYFADDLGYGIELKSMKVFDISNVQEPAQEQRVDSPTEYLSEYITPSSPSNVTKYNFLQINDMNKLNKGGCQKKNYKTSPEYEIYLQNEVQEPKSGKNKVRIYIDEDKRKIREVLNNVATFKYFDQLYNNDDNLLNV